MEFQFTVPGEPRGKGRPRFVRAGGYVRTYTPDATAAYENLVRICYQKDGGPMFEKDKPLRLDVWIYMKIPESASKSRKLHMLVGRIRPTKKPDADNVLKAILDGLNTVAFHDDSQIVEIEVHKFYNENPRCAITISEEGRSLP